MAAIDEIKDLAQDVYYAINNAENDDTGDDEELFVDGFIRSFNMWIREYEKETYWREARVNDYELATIADTTQFTFDLPVTYRTPVFDQNKELKFVLDDGTVIARFRLVNPNQAIVDEDTPSNPNRATFLSAGRLGGGKVVLSRAPRDEEVGAKIVLDVVKKFPKLTRDDAGVLNWIPSDDLTIYGIAKNQTLADVTKLSVNPAFVQKYRQELNKALAINAASTEADEMQRDSYAHIGGIW